MVSRNTDIKHRSKKLPVTKYNDDQTNKPCKTAASDYLAIYYLLKLVDQ